MPRRELPCYNEAAIRNGNPKKHPERRNEHVVSDRIRADRRPIGQGTWYLGEDPDRFDAECSALRAGVEAGMNLIDTAEMYGDGAAEELVGRAIQGLDRDKLFLVSKVYPL